MAQVKGIMTQEDVEIFAKGFRLKDFTCQPLGLEILSIDPEKNQSQICVTIAEGKFHQVQACMVATVARGSSRLATFDYGNSSIG